MTDPLTPNRAQAEALGAAGGGQYEVRIAGPDDVHYYVDELAALRAANEINVVYLSDRLRHPDDEVMCIATVHSQSASKESPGSAAGPGRWVPLAEWLSKAAADVLGERERQLAREGWTAEHDDEYINEELSCAAACYAMATGPHCSLPGRWPWASTWWKPKGRRRNLVRAGALILAEIERFDRAAKSKAPGAEREASSKKGSVT